MTAVVGRERELLAVERFLEGAVRGGAALIVEGEAGIGKTTVWREAARRARDAGILVLTARPAEAEATVALAALEELVEAVPEHAWTELSAPQLRAVEIALYRADPGERPIDQRALASAVRTLLTAAARTGPVLLAIDDVHWLDAQSAAVLYSVLRRLEPSRLGVLVTRRSTESSPLRLEDLAAGPDAVARLTVGALTVGALQRVLRDRLGRPLPRSVLVRVHRVSRGNPLFALELARALDRDGMPRAGDPLPVPDDVRELVRARVRVLPDSTRTMLVAAAAASRTTVELLRRASGREVAGDLELAEREGLVATRQQVVSFEHPLFADAILATATESELRATHRSLAEAVESREARARHRALGCSAPDEEAAELAHGAAREALLRGAPVAAAELVELALEIGAEDSPARSERVLDRAIFLYCANEPRRALDVLEAVADWSEWPAGLEARARGLLVELVLLTDGLHDAAERAERMLREPLRMETRARVLSHLSNAYSYDLARATRCDDEAMRLLDELGDDADPGTCARTLCYRVRNRLGLGYGLDRADVERVVAYESLLPPERLAVERVSYRLGIWLRHVDDLDGSRAWLERELEHAVTVSDEFLQITLLAHLGLTLCARGDLRGARLRMDQAASLADELGVRPADLLGARALVEAHLGADELPRSLARDALEASGERKSEPGAIYASAALGLLELSVADERAAFGHLRDALDGIEAAGLREPGIYRVHANAAEAALGVGDRELARSLADLLLEHATSTGHRWSNATGWRLRALLAAADGRLDDAREASEQALRLLDDLGMSFERARTLLAAGVIERRARRRTRARELLAEATEELERLGASAWAARARHELDRVGLRRSPRDELTAGERSVAELAAAGLKNREIAAALFVSPKTVEANLGRAYRKLGVRSRSELASRWSSLQT